VTSPLTRRQAAAAALAYAAALALVGLVAVAAQVSDRPFGNFSRDPTDVLNGAFFIGALSSLGVLLWWTAATAAGLAGWIARRERIGLALLAAAAFTASLALDDLFLIHEIAAPDAGVPELSIYAAYAVAAAVFAWRFGAVVVRATPWPLLALACALLAADVAVDVGTRVLLDRQIYALEDGLKLLGIVGWCAYFVTTAVGVLSERLAGEPVERAEAQAAAGRRAHPAQR
jgi:hypothetical protein